MQAYQRRLSELLRGCHRSRATNQEHSKANMDLQTNGTKTRGRSGSGATFRAARMGPSSSMNALAAAVAACLALMAGCQPADRSGTVQARIFAFDPQTHTYGVRRVAVDHLSSLVRLQGRDFSVRSGSRLYSGTGGLEIDRGGDFAGGPLTSRGSCRLERASTAVSGGHDVGLDGIVGRIGREAGGHTGGIEDAPDASIMGCRGCLGRRRQYRPARRSRCRRPFGLSRHTDERHR